LQGWCQRIFTVYFLLLMIFLTWLISMKKFHCANVPNFWHYH